MKTKFKVLSFFAIANCMLSTAHAYKYVIYTDETTTTHSEKVAELMKTTYPFNKFHIEVEIVRLPPSELECGSSQGIDRLVTCNNSGSLQRRANREQGADQAMIVKNLNKWGGSAAIGGGIPVITNGTNPRAMLHEYMHTLGLCDEYEYSASEANIYCKESRGAPNLAFITPLDSYSSDGFAREKHNRAIPWFGDILGTTPITSNGGVALGTGEVNFAKKAPLNTTEMGMVLEEPTGLYKGKVCQKDSPPKMSWHPGGSATLMENVEAGLGAPLEKIVERTLISKGARLKMQADEPAVNTAPTREEGGGVVAEGAKPEVNNSRRGFFKSFFGWIADIFRSIGRTISR